MKEKNFLWSTALLVVIVLTITTAFSNYNFLGAAENDVIKAEYQSTDNQRRLVQCDDDWIRVYEANDNDKDDAGKIIELKAEAYQIDGDIQIDVSCKATGDVDSYQIHVSNDKYCSDYESFYRKYTSKDGMCTIKKLNKSSFENYAYVRVRARILVNGAKIYGNWSEILPVYLPEEDDSDSDDQQNNAKWSIDENGTLYWSEGNVNEDGYSLEDEIPWYDQKDKIKNVVVGEGVDYISNYTFMYCENLETITIPAGVESIGPFAFWGCNNLKSINIATNNPNYVSVDGVLFNKSKTEIVIYPSAKEGKYVIPNTVTTIGENSFRECGKLSDLVIPSSVTTIGAYAFYDCTSLLNITIPKSVKEMDYCGLGLIFYKGFVGDIDDRIDGFIMKGYVGSAAETYARDNGLTFKYIANEVTNPETTTPASEQKAITSSNNTKPTLPVAENKTTSSNSNVNATLKKAVVTKLKSVKAAKKSLKILWKKVKGVSGYQVQISNSGKFKKATKTVTVKKANTTSKTIKKLKSKKQYYVRIRTYIIVNGTKKYSDWSKAKSKKTK